ncbi:hypothetical protein Btru_015077 [Bulinus truncatus]|nr:hypothetical protein Btru_015077 [Bulinus truncatus]
MRVEVFSNSPAEGELQRGDIILSINNRDASQLTHKQAQDLIKHGGGQVQLVVNRPPPGAQFAPLSPPIVTQRPRAPSLQSPSTDAPPSRSLTIVVAQNAHKPQVPVMQPLHVQPPASPQYHQIQIQRQRSTQSQPPTTPTPSTPVPPWAAQQFQPKKVSKLSKLGGGGLNFGTDYCTLPRRTSSSAQYGGRYHTQSQSSDGPDNVEPDRLATGPPPKVCSLRNLGGGGFDFGTAFGSATLPRRNTGRRYSQPPSMPGTAPYQPKKINLSKLGGGGPEFGSDFSHIAKVDGYGQTAAQRYEPSSDKSVMLNRVQSSLDNITLSPRTPEVQPTSPFYQPQASYPYSQQTFTPTGLLLEQQRLQEQQAQDEGEAIVPVWERRRQFQGTAQPSAVRTPLSKPPPKVPKPRPGPTSYGDFGTTYGPTKKAPTNNWRPAPAFKPTPAPVSATPASYTPINVQYAPKTAPKPSPPVYAPGQSPSSWQQQPSPDESTPAWRNTLKTTGVKPWEQETGYALQQEPVRSVPYTPTQAPNAAPFSPTSAEEYGGSENGPKVVHLQYNSPMGLYSNQNVAETLQGQTLALAGQTTKPPPPASNQSGERDWSQSAVLRFINQEDTRGKGKNPPAVSPKPKVYSPGQSSAQPQNYYEEIGASDFYDPNDSDPNDKDHNDKDPIHSNPNDNDSNDSVQSFSFICTEDVLHMFCLSFIPRVIVRVCLAATAQFKFRVYKIL